jgi:hypothetical protein
MDEPVTLLRGAEYLTDDGMIEVLPAGRERMKKAYAAGRNVAVEIDGRSVLIDANGARARDR